MSDRQDIAADGECGAAAQRNAEAKYLRIRAASGACGGAGTLDMAICGDWPWCSLPLRLLVALKREREQRISEAQNHAPNAA